MMNIWNENSLSLNSLQKEKLEVYAEKLCYFNRSVALYSRRLGKDFCRELILDSVLAGRLLLKDCVHPLIVDIGSGAGFPGLVLAILDPLRHFWLFEPHQKKAAFLEYISWKIDIKNIQVKNIPVQQETTLLKCAVSKAFLSLSRRLIVTQSVFEEGASYYHLQSLDWEKQWKKISLDTREKWQVMEVKKYTHPFLPLERVLIRTDKVS